MATAIVIYARLYALIGLRDNALTPVRSVHDFASSLYFSNVTWTTLGYDDITAVAPLARLFADAEALNGSLFTAIFIAVLIASFEKLMRPQTPTA
ncbi:potassium channel family protein [Caulobacter sp. CCG-8]|uniref:potassium channel family protein n=1 Tax=Caulobacter sp. CCG-8 TaxID=3127958 RepID=UPI00307F84AF